MGKIPTFAECRFSESSPGSQQISFDAQANPDEYKDLLVRMAGYSDYFNDMNLQLQNEVIARTENDEL